MAMSVLDNSHEAHSSRSTREDTEGGSSKEINGDLDGASSKQITRDLEGGSSKQLTGDLEGDSRKQMSVSCTHFSIRGYVSEVRKKNWKSSCPFSVPDDSCKLQKCEDWLPPLLVKKARWWACKNCLERSEIEAIPINGFDRNDIENLHLCFEKPTQPSSNDNDNEDEMVQLENDHSGQENIVGAVHEEPEHTIEISDSDISLDLNRPACGPSDELECSLSPANELEISELRCGHFSRVSNDQGGCLNLFRDMVGARNEHLADVSNRRITLPVEERILELSQEDNFYEKTQQVDFGGIEGIDVSLSIGAGTINQYKESNHVKDTCLESREELAGNVRSCEKKFGRLKPKKAPKIRSLTDILINTKELPSFKKLKNKKQAREIEPENTEQYPTLSRCLAELQKARHHEKQKEMRKVKTMSFIDEAEQYPTQKKKKKKNKASFFHDEASAKGSKISNMNTDSAHLALGISHEKIKGISQRSKLKAHNYEQRRGAFYNGETDLPTQERPSILQKNQPKKNSPKLHQIPQNNKPELGASAASREETVDDDIPMEIVELLARNRLERRLNSCKEAAANGSNSGPAENYTNRSDNLSFKDVQSDQRASSSRREVKNSIDLNNELVETPWTSNQFTARPLHHNENSKTVRRFAQDSSSRGNPLPSSCTQFLNDCHRNQMATQSVNDQFYRNQPTLLVPGSMPYYNAKKRTADMSSRSYVPTAYMHASMMSPPRSRERYPQFSYPISAEGTSSYENVINPLSSNDSISALNLLMLMQQGASSSTPSTNRTEKQHFPTVYPPKPSEHEAFSYGQYPRHSQSHQVKNTLDLFPSFPTLGRSATQSSAPCEDEIDRSSRRWPIDYKSGYATSKQNYALKNCRMETANQSRPAPRFLLPRPDAFLTATGFLEHLSPPHLRKTLPHLVAPQNKIQMESSARRDGNCCVLNRNPADLLDTEDIYWIGGEDLRLRKVSRLNHYSASS